MLFQRVRAGLQPGVAAGAIGVVPHRRGHAPHDLHLRHAHTAGMGHVTLPARLGRLEPLGIAQPVRIGARCRHRHHLRQPIGRTQIHRKVVAALERIPELGQHGVIARDLPVAVDHDDVAGAVEDGLVAHVRRAQVIAGAVRLLRGGNAPEDPGRAPVRKLVGLVSPQRRQRRLGGRSRRGGCCRKSCTAGTRSAGSHAGTRSARTARPPLRTRRRLAVRAWPQMLHSGIRCKLLISESASQPGSSSAP